MQQIEVLGDIKIYLLVLYGNKQFIMIYRYIVLTKLYYAQVNLHKDAVTQT